MKGKFGFDKEQKFKMFDGNWSCSLCGSNKQLQGHHITHKRNNASSIFNCLWICIDCHSKYGSSSADDTSRHLIISAEYILKKTEDLVKNDMYFKDFFTDTDRQFVNEFYSVYNPLLSKVICDIINRYEKNIQKK